VGKRAVNKSIHIEKWPVYNPKFIKEDKFELIVQINGKLRATIWVKADIEEKEAMAIVHENQVVKGYLENKPIKRVIFVPNRLVNIVV